MRKIKEIIMSALMLTLLMTTVFAQTKTVVGVTLMSLRHPFFQEMKAALEKDAKDNNIVIRLTDADFDAGKQVRQVEDYIQQKVSGILITPCDSKALAPVLKKALAAGIPVVTVDVAAEGVDVVSHCASDNVLGGKLAAQMLIQRLNERKVSKGTVLIVDHSGITSTQARIEGFKPAMAKALPDIKIVILNAVGQRDKAMSVTEDAIQKYGKNLIGIFAINDDCTLGALSAVERRNRLNTISIVGYDFGDESKAAIDAGKIVGDTVQFPSKMGVQALHTLVDYISGKNKNPPKNQPVEVGTYQKDGFKDSSGKAMN